VNEYLPLFPLNLVVFPGEELNLHIFEPRYRQLINECLDQQKPFGIPAFIDGKLPGYGTRVRIVTLDQRYDDGRLDVKTEGVSVFRLGSFENPAPGKLYAGGQTIGIPADDGYSSLAVTLSERLLQLYELLQIEADYDAALPNLSYRVAHKVGLSVEQEYTLLTLTDETERQQFLLWHLDKVIPVVGDMERTKQRIRMNGHFKNLDPLNF
jgi:Lon protease-like protein